MGRIKIQSDNIPYLVDKQRIARQLKTFCAMRFQSEGPPDPADGGLAQSSSGCQHAAGPMGSALRSFLQCQSYHPLNLVVADLARRSWTRLIPKSCNAVGDETVAPKTHRETRSPQLRRNRCVTGSLAALQNDTSAKRRGSGTARLPRNTLQLSLLRRAHQQLMLLGTSTTNFHASR
jgi:hypothetical protein